MPLSNKESYDEDMADIEFIISVLIILILNKSIDGQYAVGIRIYQVKR